MYSNNILYQNGDHLERSTLLMKINIIIISVKDYVHFPMKMNGYKYIKKPHKQSLLKRSTYSHLLGYMSPSITGDNETVRISNPTSVTSFTILFSITIHCFCVPVCVGVWEQSSLPLTNSSNSI